MRREISAPRRALLAFVLVISTMVHAYARDDDRSDRDRYDRDHGGYVFATTRGLNEMDMNPALKITILPVAVLLDVVFLPFALIADTMTR
jgi:uncharacterized protein YceK